MAKKKNPDDEGVHNAGRIESKVLKAWKRGERTAHEIAELTGIPLRTVYKYIPERKTG